ncbi:MAG: chemotaxis protein CheD [Sarcina sp.]
MEKDVVVGIADFKITKAPKGIFTIGLGSCVGISLFDNKNKIVGLIHIMLPCSNKFSDKVNPYKFADTAIPKAIEEMVKNGAVKNNITAKIAGGAQMFKSMDRTFSNEIGKRNIIAVEEALKVNGIRLLGKEVGGYKGRTMIINSNNGVVSIKSLGKNVMEF